MFLRLELAGRWWTFNTGKLQPPKPNEPNRIVGADRPLETIGFMPRRGWRVPSAPINPQMQGSEAPTDPDPVRMDAIGGVQ